MIETNEMFLVTDKLDRRVQEMAGYRFIRMTDAAPFSAMEGGLGADEVYRGIPDGVSGAQLNIGDAFNGWDRYLWVQKTIELPPHMDGCEVYGLFDFGKTGGGNNSGFESLLYVDGHPYQGVDGNHQDVNFEKLAGASVKLTFLLWTGMQGGGPRIEMQHCLKQAQIGYLHTVTDELYYLSKAIVGSVRLFAQTDPAKYALTSALDRALNLINWDCFYETVGLALSSLKADLKQMPKITDITVNVVGHTHIDVAWLWRLKHTREKAQRSFATVLKLMEEFDEYIFLQSQPQLYQYIKNDCPEIYEKMKTRISQQRWEADGGMWLEADCNITSGEALTRQFLYGMRLFEQEFGHKCEYLWLPDVFGYSWALPQILRGVGINTFMTTKISWNQFNSMPHDLFTWRGIDGSEVMAYFITTPESGEPLDARFSTYNGMLTPHAVLGSWTKFRDKNLSDETLLSYGYGDGGGGVNRDMLKMRRAMDQLPGLPAVKTERAGEFFRRMHEKIETTDQYVPVWDGELYLEYHRGTYTSQAWNKRMNRSLEFALTECEWLSEMAALRGAAYNQAALVESWQTVLRNQFHDIIPGSSITEVYQDCRTEYSRVADTLQSVADNALSTLIKAGRDAWTIWHFGSFARRDQVFIPEPRDGTFCDENGARLETQKSQGGYWVGVMLPATSAATIRFSPGQAQTPSNVFHVDLNARTLRTPLYEAAWNEQGQLVRLYDRENMREVIPKGEMANTLEVYEDKPNNFDNWDVDIFHLLKHETVEASGAPEVIEKGTLRVVLRFTYVYRQSAFTQDVIFYADNRRIDFSTQAEWHEKHRLLKAGFPVTIRSTKASYDIQYGHVERPAHFNTSWDYARFEVVAHKWMDMSEEGYGVSLLNNCKYGHSAKDHVMHITLLKSGKYPDPEADMGHHCFTYALLPHAGSVAKGDTIEEAVKLNLPVYAIPGQLTAPMTAFTSDCRNVYIDAVKKAEDDDCLILRIHECRGGHASAELTPGFAIKAYAPCNLLEETTGSRMEADSIRVVLSPFQIQTFKIWTK